MYVLYSIVLYGIPMHSHGKPFPAFGNDRVGRPSHGTQCHRPVGDGDDTTAAVRKSRSRRSSSVSSSSRGRMPFSCSRRRPGRRRCAHGFSLTLLYTLCCCLRVLNVKTTSSVHPTRLLRGLTLLFWGTRRPLTVSPDFVSNCNTIIASLSKNLVPTDRCHKRISAGLSEVDVRH